VRTPAPNELEYLDVFDFFNFPRLPASQGGDSLQGNGNGGVSDMGLSDLQGGANDFNITNFMMDPSSDWLFKNQG
jgi:hypothetical protein